MYFRKSCSFSENPAYHKLFKQIFIAIATKLGTKNNHHGSGDGETGLNMFDIFFFACGCVRQRLQLFFSIYI